MSSTHALDARSLRWLAALALLALGCERETRADTPAPLAVEVDTRAPSRPISPYIYGINGLDHTTAMEGVITLLRFGGTRASTYDWENNASNAGHDYPPNQNDGYLSESTAPGAAVLHYLDRAADLGAAVLVTVPMLGHVAADRRADGDVGRSPDYLATRFRRSLARGGGDGAPSLDDGVVHQDAFVRFVRREAEQRGVRVFFALDNEPAGWPATQPLLRAHRPLTYRELARTSAEYAAMIHDEAPSAHVFGPVTFGWPDMTTLAGAPDANGRDFLGFYLAAMRAEARRRGHRILDVLDVHWYPDVRIGEQPVTSGDDDGERARARMQLPRSLYDPSYREASWIAESVGPVRLLPRLRSLIRRSYPDTKIAITEYAYGGGARPSGAVAMADALGAFGREGVFAAAYWPLTNQRHRYALGALRMFRRVDGEISFGDRSIPARSSDLSRLSAWASLDSAHPGRVVLVLVGRMDRPSTARLTIRGLGDARVARRFVLDASARAPREAGAIEPSTPGLYEVPIPARSVTTLVFDAQAR